MGFVSVSIKAIGKATGDKRVHMANVMIKTIGMIKTLIIADEIARQLGRLLLFGATMSGNFTKPKV